MAVFKANYNGRCSKCNESIVKGTLVSWSRRHKGVIYHAACNPDDKDVLPARNDAPAAPDAPAPQPVNDDAVRAIAREVAQEEDLSHIPTLLRRVDSQVKTTADAMFKDMEGKVANIIANNVPRRVEIVVKDRNGNAMQAPVVVDTAHRELETLIYLITKRMNVYAFGDPGSGKSSGAFQAFKVLGMDAGYCSLNPQTPESRLLGFIDAGGIYRETEFYRRFTQGGGFIIDEGDNGHPALLNTLNGMFESDAQGIGHGAFPCGNVIRHPDFVCVMTGNTNGRGGDRLFPERRALDTAFLERFAFIRWDYDETMERAVTMGINADAVDWLKWVHEARAYCKQHSLRIWITPRASFKGAELLKDGKLTVERIADLVVFKGMDADTVKRVLDACPLPQA